MKIKKIIAFRVNLWDINKHPSEIFNKYKPLTSYRKAWIPQTIADQVWVFYGFYSEKDADEWIKTLPKCLIDSIDEDLIEDFKRDNWGWNIRDQAGFIVKEG